MAIFYYCPDCGSVYGHFFKPDCAYTTPCPKADCYGEVFEVDELMLPTIIELNKKGYITEFCCSGHWAESFAAPYIKFQSLMDYEKQYLQNSLPEPWFFEEDDIIIRVSPKYFVNSDNPIKKFEQICYVNKILFEWAYNLKDYEDADYYSD